MRKKPLMETSEFTGPGARERAEKHVHRKGYSLGLSAYPAPRLIYKRGETLGAIVPFPTQDRVVIEWWDTVKEGEV